VGQKIWQRFHEGLQPITPAYCDVYNALWQAAKRQGCHVKASRATLAAMSGRTERTTRSATTFWEEQGLLWVERKRLGPNRNAINIYHLRHVWIHWFRWEPSKKDLHKRATDLGDPPHFSKRENSQGPTQKCSEKVASQVWSKTAPQWYYCQGLIPPWEEEDKKKVPGVRKE
jgi:hypothetical protein